MIDLAEARALADAVSVVDPPCAQMIRALADEVELLRKLTAI